jgi:hypothetical protein
MKTIFPLSYAMPETRPVACGCLENWLFDLNLPTKTNEANQRFAQHLGFHRDDLFTIPRQPCLNATN